MMATVSCEKSPLWRRMVNMSSMPWVGWAWRPSPALITLTWGLAWRAMKWAAPLSAWRTTNMSTCMASRLRRVSSRVSPLAVAEVEMLRLSTSAERRLAASSKVVRVRVLFSKKRLATTLPRHRGTFLTACWATPRKPSLRSRISVSSSAAQALDGQEVLEVALGVELGQLLAHAAEPWSEAPRPWAAPERFFGDPGRSPMTRAQVRVSPRGDQFNLLSRRQVGVEPRQVGGDGQLAPVALHQGHQDHRGRPAVVEEDVECGADGPPGLEHVVHQDQVTPLHRHRQVGGPHLGVIALAGEVVPVVGDVQVSQGLGQPDLPVQALGHPNPPGVDADHQRALDAAAGEQFGQFGAEAAEAGGDLLGALPDVSVAHRARFPG